MKIVDKKNCFLLLFSVINDVFFCLSTKEKISFFLHNVLFIFFLNKFKLEKKELLKNSRRR